MANAIVQVEAPTGLTLTLSLYAFSSDDTLANSGGADTLTEKTNNKGLYAATVTEGLSGWHWAKILDGSSNLIGHFAVWMSDTTNIHRCVDLCDVYAWSGAVVTLSTGNKPDVNVDEISDDATAPATLELFAEALDQATGQIDNGTFASGAIDAATIANGAIDAATFAADVDAEVLSYIVDDATRIDASALNTASATTIPAISAIFTGITSLAQWLGLIAGKQTGNSTARTELRATGAGSGTYDETTDSLEAVRDNTGTAGAGLTNIDLPDQTMNITGNLSGSVGSVTGAVGSVTGSVGGNVTGSVGSLATQAKADVNAEVLDVLNTDTFAEPGQGTPAATASLAAKIGYMYKSWRNKKTQTSTQWSLYNDDTTTIDHKATVSDDGTTTTKTEIATGP